MRLVRLISLAIFSVALILGILGGAGIGTAQTTSVTAAPPSGTCYRAVNLNGPAQLIGGNNWENGSGAAPNFSITPGATGMCNTWSPLNPPAGEYATMVRCALQHWSHQLTMSNLPNGMYDLSVYVFQDYNNSAAGTTTLRVQGVVVNSSYAIPTRAGAWQKLTYRASVAGGDATI